MSADLGNAFASFTIYATPQQLAALLNGTDELCNVTLWVNLCSFQVDNEELQLPLDARTTQMLRCVAQQLLSATSLNGVSNVGHLTNCVWCKKYFVQDRTDQKYCSKKCKAARDSRDFYEKNRSAILAKKKAEYQKKKRCEVANEGISVREIG